MCSEKKNPVIIDNKFSPETEVLRKIVVEAKTLSLIIALFTVEILLVLCARNFRLYFAVGKKIRHRFAIFIIFSPVCTLRSVLAERGLKPAQHFQKIYLLREHWNLENWGGNAIGKLQTQCHTSIDYKNSNNSRKLVSTQARVALVITTEMLISAWTRSCTFLLIV